MKCDIIRWAMVLENGLVDLEKARKEAASATAELFDFYEEKVRMLTRWVDGDHAFLCGLTEKAGV